MHNQFEMGPHPPGIFDDISIVETNDTDANLTTSAAFIATTEPSNVTTPEHLCRWILYQDIAGSSVRYWDLCILVPNALFLLFLGIGLQTAVVKLKRTNSPIFLAFYGLVLVVAIISVLRCIVSMTVNAAILAADIADQVLWLVLRFFLLATELSVVIFGLAFGHLDSRTSIQRVLLVTFTVSLLYSSTQGVLEFLFPDERFRVVTPDQEYDIFGHGGMLFWFASSIFFFAIYIVICLLPFTKIRQKFALPTKKAFYWYCLFLAFMNVIQAVGSGLLYYHIIVGMCMVDLTTYVYFTCFTPLVYFTFLRDFFRRQPPSILFSYKAHVDDDDNDDTVNLPQQSYATPPAMPGQLSDVNEMYDSTDFDQQTASPNPLYDGMSDMPPSFRPRLAINAEYFDGPDDT